MPEVNPEALAPQGNPQARQKPLLTVPEQIEHLKFKGVTFDLCTEREAADYLEHANNYLRAASYRKLFPVRLEGPDAGKYIGLDFAALVALSSADRVLRSSLREICIDVEHFARVELINQCMAHGEDGYAIVSDYLEHLKAVSNTRVALSLKTRSASGKYPDAYSGDLIAHYSDDLGGLAAWTLLEVVDFGSFADFWLFCASRWAEREMLEEHYVLRSAKGLRNATAHNSCVINGFSKNGERAGFEVRDPIASSMKALGLKNTKSRRAKLSNLRVAQISAVLYASSRYCTRDSTRWRHVNLMSQAKVTIDAALPLCPADGSLEAYFDFLFKMVDIWLPPCA